MKLVATIGLLLVALWAGTAQAQTTLMSEGFEGACATVSARWPAQSYSGFPCTGQMVINTNPAFVRSGSQSLKMIFEGGEIHGGFVDLDWPDRTHKSVVVTYDTYMVAPFYTGGDTAHGVGGIGTKGIYMFMYSASRGQYWGWVPNWIWGGKQHTLGTQGCVQNDNGIPYDSTFFYQNVTPYHQEENKWVRHEVKYDVGTPGNADGLLEEYQTPFGGTRTLTTRYANRRCLDATTSGQMPSDAKWGRIRLYRQYGLGTIYIDNISVTTDYIGSGGGSTGDTTPPAPPTGFTVSQLWEWLKDGLLALLMPSEASAMTPTTAELTWTPTTDATIRYELRWKHFANQWAWESIAKNLDSTAGAYTQTFPALPDTTGDRGACWDARAVRGSLASPWLSEVEQQVCTQMPVGLPSPTPVPLPTPEPPPAPAPEPELIGPAIVTMSGDKVFIACDPARYTRAKTTGTGTKRTITCLK